MADADRLDLVIRPGRICIEDAGWNFLGFITRGLQGDGFGCIDGEKLRLTRARAALALAPALQHIRERMAVQLDIQPLDSELIELTPHGLQAFLAD